MGTFGESVYLPPSSVDVKKSRCPRSSVGVMVSTVLGTAGRVAGGFAAIDCAPSTSTDVNKALAKIILDEITC